MDVKGLSIQDIIDLNIDEVMSMSKSELKKVTSRLVSASNKRLRRLKGDKSKMGKYSPVYRKQQFSVKGKNLNEVRKEFASMKRFLTSKTSTLRGWKLYRREVEIRLGGKLPKNMESKYWRVYRKFSEVNYGGLKAVDRGSERMQRYLREQYIDKRVHDEGELLKQAEQELERIYLSE